MEPLEQSRLTTEEQLRALRDMRDLLDMIDKMPGADTSKVPITKTKKDTEPAT